MVHSITILTGADRNGVAEPVERIEFKAGDIVSIVGPTGSGKTTLINDIELFADRNTPTGRKVLINGAEPPEDYRNNPAHHPIALITQHTTFLSDLPVGEFLRVHASIRSGEKDKAEKMVSDALDFANQLTGEPISPASRMTELSGGQTRSLLIADAAVICNTPIVLLDEVENAGIDRARVLELLKQYDKIFIFVTHDPHIALISDYRIVMKGGSVVKIIHSSEKDKACADKVARLDSLLTGLRNRIRNGEDISPEMLEEAI